MCAEPGGGDVGGGGGIGGSGGDSALPLLRASSTPAASLSAEYLRAEALYHHISAGSPLAECNGGDGSSHDLARHTTDALAAFLRCSEAIRREALFSSNEDAADVPTAHLQYLLCEYYVASLWQRAPVSAGAAGDLASARLAQLRSARAELEAFLHRIVSVRGLVADADARAIGLIDTVSRAGSSSSSSGGRVPDRADPGTLRSQKIERFKRGSAAAKRLRELAAMNARTVEAARKRGMDDAAAIEEAALDGIGASPAMPLLFDALHPYVHTGGCWSPCISSARAYKCCVKHVSVSAIFDAARVSPHTPAGSSLGGPIDDSARREMVLLTILGAVAQALDDLASVAQEEPLLAHMAAQNAEGACVLRAARLPTEVCC